MSPLFECIALSWSVSLKDIKLIDIVIWIFMIFFKYTWLSLIKVIFDFYYHYFHIWYNVTIKVTNSYWFLIIFFFFWLKKSSNDFDSNVLLLCFLLKLEKDFVYLYLCCLLIAFIFFFAVFGFLGFLPPW